MTCQVIRGQVMSLFDSKELAGTEHGWPHRGYRVIGDRKVLMTKAEQLAEMIAEEKRIMVGSTDPMWCCGSGPPEPVCRCGHIADLLCDYPMGRGKTCDLPICPKCSVRIRDEVDLCTVHAIEHRAGKLRVVT